MTFSTQNSYDVAIAGAGPAGSSLAIRLATAGLSILLVEQKKFPRDKLCGEFITPECLGHFDELGISSDFSASRGTPLSETVFYARSGKGVSVRSEWFGNTGSLAIGLSRAAMDDLLVERAKSVGVFVCEETSVSTVLIEGERVVGATIKDKNGNASDVSAKITIDATGRTRSLARRFESKQNKDSAKYVAFKTHLRGARIDSGACEIYFYRGGYGGCNRVENDLYNLCFIASAEETKRLGSDAERVMREVVFTNKRAATAMKDASVAKPWLAVPIERFGRGKLVPAEGLISVGDAAAFIDPFTGSGILLALESGKIASDALLRSNDFVELTEIYNRGYSQAFNSRLRVCSMLRHAAFTPLLAESVISILRLNQALSRNIARATRFSG